MSTDRRTLLKGLCAAATCTVAGVSAVEAREKKVAPADAVGLLYDATKCIGCKACVAKCKEVNKLQADVDGYGDGLYDAPEGLNEYTKNVIQLAKYNGETSYVKKQCMHCVDPACTSACMMGALHKGKFGIVEWEANKCIGCRYCQVACPFGVPKFQWSKLSPRLVKCELCKDRLAEGKLPGCVEACPRQAVIYGKREELLQEAHRRIATKPDLYVNKVYGEKELGGTQVLYISHVPFENLGFRFQQEEAVPNLQQTVQHGIYKGFAAPLALYGILGAVMFRNRKKGDANDDVR
ncbi:MAG TPA: hydrogenase 2 operon protein HybA [Thermoanaerobaculia bacterium]